LRPFYNTITITPIAQPPSDNLGAGSSRLAPGIHSVPDIIRYGQHALTAQQGNRFATDAFQDNFPGRGAAGARRLAPQLVARAELRSVERSCDMRFVRFWIFGWRPLWAAPYDNLPAVGSAPTNSKAFYPTEAG